MLLSVIDYSCTYVFIHFCSCMYPSVWRKTECKYTVCPLLSLVPSLYTQAIAVGHYTAVSLAVATCNEVVSASHAGYKSGPYSWFEINCYIGVGMAISKIKYFVSLCDKLASTLVCACVCMCACLCVCVHSGTVMASWWPMHAVSEIGCMASPTQRSL